MNHTQQFEKLYPATNKTKKMALDQNFSDE